MAALPIFGWFVPFGPLRQIFNTNSFSVQWFHDRLFQFWCAKAELGGGRGCIRVPGFPPWDVLVDTRSFIAVSKRHRCVLHHGWRRTQHNISSSFGTLLLIHENDLLRVNEILAHRLLCGHRWTLHFRPLRLLEYLRFRLCRFQRRKHSFFQRLPKLRSLHEVLLELPNVWPDHLRRWGKLVVERCRLFL